MTDVPTTEKRRGLRRGVKRALVAADAAWIRSLDLIRPTRKRTILMEVRNHVGFASQALIIAELVARGRFHLHVTSGTVTSEWLRDGFDRFGLDPGMIIPAHATAYRRYDVAVITDSPTVRIRRRHPVLYLTHGSSFGNLPSPYSFEFLKDNSADFVCCFAAAQINLAVRLLEPALIPRLIVVGPPKLDPLVQGKYDRAGFLRSLGLDPAKPTILLASHWSPESLYRSAPLGPLSKFLATSPINVIVSGHEHLFDVARPHCTGGVNWHDELGTLFCGANMRVLHERFDNTPLLGSADLLIADHSSIHIEFAALYRPMILYKHPDFSFCDPEMLRRLRATSMMVDSAERIPDLVRQTLAEPAIDRERRRELLDYAFAYLGRSVPRVADVVAHIASYGRLPRQDSGTAVDS